jgi:hypothetical protein
MTTARGSLAGAVAVATAIVLASCHGTEATYSIGGNLSGTTGPVVLKLNGANDIGMSGDGTFKFDQKLLTNDTFNVQIADPADRCAVANGAGVVGKSNITNVTITCAAQVLQTVIRTANLSGATETPLPVTTTASGAGGVVVVPNVTQMPMTGGVTFTGLTPIEANIHLAPSGNPAGSGAAIVPLILAADGFTAVVPPGTTLDAALLGPLLRGELYFNVTTAANPNGEIRGAIELQGGVAASVAVLDQTQVVPPSGSAAVGVGTLLANRATGKIIISYITHTVASASGADIHTSAGLGSAIVAFTNLQTGVTAGTNLANPPAGATMTTQNLSDFDHNLLYFNVASGAKPNGEIRGNIAPQ